MTWNSYLVQIAVSGGILSLMGFAALWWERRLPKDGAQDKERQQPLHRAGAHTRHRLSPEEDGEGAKEMDGQW